VVEVMQSFKPEEIGLEMEHGARSMEIFASDKTLLVSPTCITGHCCVLLASAGWCHLYSLMRPLSYISHAPTFSLSAWTQSSRGSNLPVLLAQNASPSTPPPLPSKHSEGWCTYAWVAFQSSPETKSWTTFHDLPILNSL